MGVALPSVGHDLGLGTSSLQWLISGYVLGYGGLLLLGGRTADLLGRRLPPGAFHQFMPLDAPTYVERFLDHWRRDIEAVSRIAAVPAILEAMARSTGIGGSADSAARVRKNCGPKLRPFRS